MKCPDCGSEESIRDSAEVFCKKCGLELEDSVLYDKGKGSRTDAEKIVKLPKIVFKTNSKQELFALKLGLKHKKLSPDWSNNLGFKIKGNYLKPEYKEKVLGLIEKALKKNSEHLIDSEERISKNWKNIQNIYWVEIENLMNFKWNAQKYLCYLSLVCNGGFHNSSKNSIIIRSKLDKMSNYVIAHELFHIIFRNYITKFFKEKYNDSDEDLSEVVVNFVLLTHPKIKSLFPDISFSLDFYALEKHKELAEKLWPIWKEQKSFKEFMIETYKNLRIEKTWISY